MIIHIPVIIIDDRLERQPFVSAIFKKTHLMVKFDLYVVYNLIWGVLQFKAKNKLSKSVQIL